MSSGAEMVQMKAHYMWIYLCILNEYNPPEKTGSSFPTFQFSELATGIFSKAMLSKCQLLYCASASG